MLGIELSKLSLSVLYKTNQYKNLKQLIIEFKNIYFDKPSTNWLNLMICLSDNHTQAGLVKERRNSLNKGMLPIVPYIVHYYLFVEGDTAGLWNVVLEDISVSNIQNNTVYFLLCVNYSFTALPRLSPTHENVVKYRWRRSK